jgi:hypothetical protein
VVAFQADSRNSACELAVESARDIQPYALEEREKRKAVLRIKDE